jgi:hypothetical protein
MTICSPAMKNFVSHWKRYLRECLTTLNDVPVTDKISLDRGEIFLHPVNRQEVPDYYEVIIEPRSWLYIDDMLDRYQYRQIAEFKVS